MVLPSVLSDTCAIDRIWEARNKVRRLPMLRKTNASNHLFIDESAMPIGNVYKKLKNFIIDDVSIDDSSIKKY